MYMYIKSRYTLQLAYNFNCQLYFNKTGKNIAIVFIGNNKTDIKL